MLIRCGTFAAEYNKAEVDAMCAQMAEFQKGVAVQRATENFHRRPCATGLGIDIVRTPSARTFLIKEPVPDSDGTIWMNAGQMQAHIDQMRTEGK